MRIVTRPRSWLRFLQQTGSNPPRLCENTGALRNCTTIFSVAAIRATWIRPDAIGTTIPALPNACEGRSFCRRRVFTQPRPNPAFHPRTWLACKQPSERHRALAEPQDRSSKSCPCARSWSRHEGRDDECGAAATNKPVRRGAAASRPDRGVSPEDPGCPDASTAGRGGRRAGWNRAQRPSRAYCANGIERRTARRVRIHNPGRRAPEDQCASRTEGRVFRVMACGWVAGSSRCPGRKRRPPAADRG